ARRAGSRRRRAVHRSRRLTHTLPAVLRETWVAAVVLLLAVTLAGCSSDSTGGAKPVAATKPVEFTGDIASFYVPPDPLPDGTHGDLIRYQRYPDDAGRRVFLVMYLSESIAGDPIAVT